uniref:Uncharacterized protein n=1 Tax=Setaria digitata TaxID=48799 RepID=A0A915Q0G5_9BILA
MFPYNNVLFSRGEGGGVRLRSRSGLGSGSRSDEGGGGDNVTLVRHYENIFFVFVWTPRHSVFVLS